MTMTITDGSHTVDATEYFLLSASTTKVDQTVDCETQLFLDVGAMAAGDAVEVRLYETINGTQRSEVWTIGGASSGLWLSPKMNVGTAWEWSLKRVLGSNRSIGFSVRNDAGGGGDATAANQTTILARLPAALVSGRMDASVGAYASGLTPLQPTTAGRTLDVTATGEAGIDWANIGSPTTVVGLTGTTVKTATDVETDTADIQSRLPAALVLGRIDASAGAIDTDAISAAAVSAAAVTKVQSGLATSAALAAVDAAVTAIKTVTDAIPATLATIAGYIDTEVASIKAVTDGLGAAISGIPNAAANATAVWADAGATALAAAVAAIPNAAANAAAVLAATIHTGWSVARALRVALGGVAGKSNAGTHSYVDDSGDAIVATIDGSGNRTAVTHGA